MASGYDVILVEDDKAARTGIAQALRLAEFSVLELECAEGADRRIDRDFAGVVITDLKLPGMDGLSLLRQLQTIDPKIPIVIITGHGDIEKAVNAMREGAYDFITKPFSSDHLVEVVRRARATRKLLLEVAWLQGKLKDRLDIESRIVGRSHSIERVRRLITELADTSANVLIVGDTGTGKELVARCLHDLGRYRKGNFVALNCAGFPESLFESEIFGHEAGAFTGAAKRRIGKIEHAHKGTLFLDEIESMPSTAQGKFLRVLQEREFERLGSNDRVKVDFRVVAGSKGDLWELSRENRFREDLYFRLNVACIELPPLRERREDIPLLFEHFIREAAVHYGRAILQTTHKQMHDLMAHSWPGNIRELYNVACRFVLNVERPSSPVGVSASLPLSDQVAQFERTIIERELLRQRGCVSATGDALGMPKKTLYDKLRRYGISARDINAPRERLSQDDKSSLAVMA